MLKKGQQVHKTCYPVTRPGIEISRPGKNLRDTREVGSRVTRDCKAYTPATQLNPRDPIHFRKLIRSSDRLISPSRVISFLLGVRLEPEIGTTRTVIRDVEAK